MPDPSDPESAENPYQAPLTASAEPDVKSSRPSPRGILYVQLAAAVAATLAAHSETNALYALALSLAVPAMLIAVFAPPILVLWLIRHRPPVATALWSLIASTALSIESFVALTSLIS